MKKVIGLSFICASVLIAQDSVDIGTISVEEKVNTKIVKNVSSEQIKSADLAEALSKNVPSVSLVRRSGIANDIILRGAKKDNINVLIDDSKIYGACPNRMDPTTSHILTNNIDSIEIIEGPFDVENFGTLSGLVKVKTKEPTEKLSGDINLNIGSFGYRKTSFNVSGGNEYIKFLLSASKEKSDSYEDGDGNNFYEQQVYHGIPTANRYSSSDLEAYDKKTLLAKTIINLDDSSELTLSYTANRSDNILYPNTPMDADYDDSNIYTVEYTKRDLGEFSKELNLEYYYSDVDHPMSTTLRNNGAMMMTNHMKSSIWGTKLKNSFDLFDGTLLTGLDMSERNWKGKYYNKMNSYIRDSISSTDTKNKAAFLKYEKSFGKLDIDIGTRYDRTSIDTENTTMQDKDYNALNGHIFAVYNLDEDTKLFAGVGKSERVPDARELYIVSSTGMVQGNDNLESVKNREIDLGFEKTIGDFNIKTKVFYSNLDDYIYNINGTTFQNIDAKIYGMEVSGYYLFSENLIFDYGVSYLRGKKDEAILGQTDRDLAEIPPLKGTLSLTYDFGVSQLTTQMIASKGWSNYDIDNGEQDLGAYTVFNAKYNHKISKNFDITLGVDNIFDKTYASTNTYNDIRYIGAGNTELLNDPGRYAYVNLKFSF
ncbi:TonB-dependent receptor [Halarcobacter sp.]|uniref:TonB-dependent receptor n=1 Tax=Halarcobacter sp. TaxID=2321133 RepID=UPI0029F4F947|nr:TonB-dependent receptor [Halarcobacter sp.]